MTDDHALDDLAQGRFEEQQVQVLNARWETSSHSARRHWCARSFSNLSCISFAPQDAQDALFTSANVSS